MLTGKSSRSEKKSNFTLKSMDFKMFIEIPFLKIRKFGMYFKTQLNLRHNQLFKTCNRSCTY